jgi:hypothetical protein
LNVQLLSEDKKSVLTLDVDQADLSSYPSYNLSVEVMDGNFRGAVVTWMALDDLNTFLHQLEQCEQTRRGRAVLVSMDPDAFVLRIENSERLGHFVTHYQLTERNYTSERGTPCTLSGGFALDAELFAILVRDFAQFAVSASAGGRR